jgi:uncharacterized protein YbbK (DUF523 family)
MEKVLVSACLLGSKVRYNGSFQLIGHAILSRWQAEGWIVPLCPEIAAGFPTPRPPAEIRGGADGAAVLEGRAQVVEQGGNDVSSLYVDGARIALELARENGCRFAVLTDGSPSCGSTFVYDGSFSGRRLAGRGTTTALLEAAGICVYSEHGIAELDRLLTKGSPGPVRGGVLPVAGSL